MNKVQKILLVVSGFATLADAFLGPIYALYVEKIGGDLLDASITYAIFMLTSGIAIYFIAKIEDKSKHQEKFVVIGYGLSVIGYIGYLFVSSVMMLFLVQILMGISAALRDPAYDALFSANRKHLALAWGDWEAIYYIGMGAGAIIGGMIGTYFGFQALLAGMLGMASIAFATSLLLLKKRYANV